MNYSTIEQQAVKDINSVNNILMNGRISSNGTVALEIDVKALGIKKKTNRLHL